MQLLGSSFIIRVRSAKGVLKITMLDLKTRDVYHFSSWEVLFQSLKGSLEGGAEALGRERPVN